MTLDLVVLAADKSIEQALAGLLTRPEAIRIRPPSCTYLTHPGHDPGCYHQADELLQVFARDAAHALVILDRAWDGAPLGEPARLAADVEGRLRSRWGDRARCIVIDPELEAWVWSDSPEVDQVLGWGGRAPDLRSWLRERGLWMSRDTKPSDPKAAFDAALRAARTPKSAAVFRRLGERVSFQRCSDPSFLLLLAILRGWFGIGTGPSPTVVSESDRPIRKLRRRPGGKGRAGPR
jgi:hypothetical protein